MKAEEMVRACKEFGESSFRVEGRKSSLGMTMGADMLVKQKCFACPYLLQCSRLRWRLFIGGAEEWTSEVAEEVDRLIGLAEFGLVTLEDPPKLQESIDSYKSYTEPMRKGVIAFCVGSKVERNA